MRFPKKIALAAGVISTAALLASGTVMAAGLSACPTGESSLNFLLSQIATATEKTCVPATNPLGNGTLVTSGGYEGTVLVGADNNAITLPSDGSGQACAVAIQHIGGWEGSLLLYGAKAGKLMIQNLNSNLDSLRLTQSDVYVGPNFEGGAVNNGLQGRLCTYKLGNTPYVYQLVYFPQNPGSGLYQSAGHIEQGTNISGGVQLQDNVTALTAGGIDVFNQDNQLDNGGNVQSTTVNLHYKDPNDALCPSGYGAYVVKVIINYTDKPSSTEIDTTVNNMLEGTLGFCQPSNTQWQLYGRTNNDIMYAYCDQNVNANKVGTVVYGWNCARTQGVIPMTQSSRLLRK